MDRKQIRKNIEAAEAAGEKHYMGSDCKKKHGSKRYLRGGDCIMCARMKNTTRNSIRLAKDRSLYEPHMIEWVCGFQVQGLR